MTLKEVKYVSELWVNLFSTYRALKMDLSKVMKASQYVLLKVPFQLLFIELYLLQMDLSPE